MLTSFLFPDLSLSDNDEEAAFPLFHTLDFHDSVLSLDVSVVDSNLSDGASSVDTVLKDVPSARLSHLKSAATRSKSVVPSLGLQQLARSLGLPQLAPSLGLLQLAPSLGLLQLAPSLELLQLTPR